MAFDTHANLIKVTVTAAPSPATSGTTLAISDTDRTALINAGLTAPFNMSAQPSSGATETNTEILRVTAIGAASSYNAGNTQLTVTRNAETTPGGARSIVVGDYLTLDISKKTIVDIETPLATLSDFVVSGLNPSLPGATLTMTIPAGVLWIQDNRLAVNADGGHTYTASNDCYVDVDTAGVYHYSTVANNAAAPALTANSIRIAKVVTNGTQVSSIIQDGSRDSLGNLIYPTKAVNGILQNQISLGQLLKLVDNTHDYKIQFGVVATTAIASNQELDINITLGTAWSTKHVAFFAIGYPDASWSGFGISGGGVIGGTSLTQGFVHFHNGSTAQNIINLCWVSIGY